MRSFLRRALLGPLLGVIAITATACTVTNGHPAPPCVPSAKLVPTCGVIWGAATDPNTLTQLQSVERQLGRGFDMTYRFHALDDRIPTQDERAVVASRHILHVSIDARLLSNPQATVAWASVADGQHDSTLTEQARGIASLKVPVFVTFDHEPDQPADSAKGTAKDYVAAWRHVHDLFAAAGATNAVWVWVVTGESATFARAAQLWPGNDDVDWISWEAYNPAGCRQNHTDPRQSESFADSALPFYRWIKQHGPMLGIDTTKPMMISEAGSVLFHDDPALTASWYAQIPNVLASHPQIRAIGLWDRPGNAACNFRFDDAPAVVATVRHAGLSAPIWSS